MLSIGLSVAAGALLTGGRVSAHEGDYYPDETIPEKARVIIEDTTTGGSTALIYAGIGGLVVAGAAVYLYNLARGRRGATSTATESADATTNTEDETAAVDRP